VTTLDKSQEKLHDHYVIHIWDINFCHQYYSTNKQVWRTLGWE